MGMTMTAGRECVYCGYPATWWSYEDEYRASGRAVCDRHKLTDARYGEDDGSVRRFDELPHRFIDPADKVPDVPHRAVSEEALRDLRNELAAIVELLRPVVRPELVDKVASVRDRLADRQFAAIKELSE